MVAHSDIGVGLRMVEGPSRRIGVDVGELQPFVVWSASQPVVAQVEDARNGWVEIVNIVHQLGPTERFNIRGKVTPIWSEASLDKNGRPLVRY